VIFKKYDEMFKEIFKDPANDPPRQPRSRKSRKLPCTAKDVYDFCWAFFVRVKTNFSQIREELVSCFHLLLACLDYIYGNSLVANRRELFNPEFPGLPSDFHSRDYKAPTDPGCIVECLYSRNSSQDEKTVVDVKRIKTHVLKPYVKSLIEKELLKGDKKTLCGILDTAVFDLNKKVVNNDYEDYVHRVGDFDERIFSSPDALTEIGTPVKATFNSIASFEEQKLMVYPARRNLQSQFDGSHHLALATPLTGRNFLKAKEPGSVTPVSTATQSVSRLQALVSGRQTGPSEELRRIFNECSNNPGESI
jgi:retinoblastoma-like protein 1